MWKALFSVLSPPGRRARLSILIFHRVLAAPDPLFPHEVDAARFDAICGWVRSWFNVLPLDQAVRDMQAGVLPERALAITFDDGYADNRLHALPILQKHGLSATFFVATGFLDGGRMWNDTVVEAIRHSTLDSLPLQELPNVGLRRMPIGAVSQRRAAIDAVIQAAMYLPQGTRSNVADRLAELAGVVPSSDLMMSARQVVELHRAKMQIGAHTVSHPILTQLDDAAARTEIASSKSRLEELVCDRIRLFAYPNGRPGADYSAASVRLAREVGFDAAVSTAWGSSGPETDCFQLPRFTPWDRSRTRFAARLAGNLWTSRRRPARTVMAAVPSPG
ncbi:MAG: polysaccharide deacetylase family protein [Caldimonas sp.]